MQGRVGVSVPGRVRAGLMHGRVVGEYAGALGGGI
jgi:hypothetical protein